MKNYMSIKHFFEAMAKKADVIFKPKTSDKIFSSRRAFDSVDDAERAFKKSVEKLFNVEKWSLLPGITSTFELFDKRGVRKNSGRLEVGDFIRIILPGPFPENWVQINDIKREQNSAWFTVSPSPDPREKEDDVEHFFIDEATSTFKVERKGVELIAYEIGKTEHINNKGGEADEREVLNTIIAGGGWAGFQKIQWKKLTDYLVHRIKLEE
jgi:hypothetical protein